MEEIFEDWEREFILDWREFSKTSRVNICDLRFEEILQKILSERDGNGINRSVEGNGKEIDRGKRANLNEEFF